MSENFDVDKSVEKIPVIHAVFNSLKQSVAIESKLLKEVEYMEKIGLTSTTEYKLTKMRQFEESFFAHFLLRLVRSLKDKKTKETYIDCVRSVRTKMSTWKKSDKDMMRREYGKNPYNKKIINECIETSYTKFKEYLNLLENELKKVT